MDAEVLAITSSRGLIDLGDVSQFVIVESLNVILLHESIDVLLDVGNLGREAISDLGDDFFNEQDVLEFLAPFHDTDNDGLDFVRTNDTRCEKDDTYLEQQLSILFDSLVRVFRLNLLFCLGSDIQVDLDLLILEVVVQDVAGTRARFAVLG
jgi:hypothetical protein